MTKVGTLYKLNFPNGKSYIGITTKGIDNRIRGHEDAARRGSPAVVAAAWRVHGAPCVDTLARLRVDDLPAAEIRAIRVFGTLVPNGYNVALGGQTSPMHAPGVAAKVSAALKGRAAPWSKGDKNPMRRPDVAALVGAAHRGRPKSQEQKAKLSAATKRQLAAHNVWVGRHHTPETIEKIKAAASRRTQEWRDKMSAAVKGFRHTEETKKKMSASHTGKKRSEAHAAALRASMTRGINGRFESLRMGAVS